MGNALENLKQYKEAIEMYSNKTAQRNLQRCEQKHKESLNLKM